MHLKHLRLTNFKNYEEAELQFSDKINCFVGANGVGKTNLLDAIYYLSFCKSYFNPVDTQNIKHEEDFFAIHGTYNRNGNDSSKVSCIQKRNHRKQFMLNGKEYGRFADHIGLFPLVMISPYDRDLINEGSDVRRKYIDSVISQFDKIYLDNLINYNRALFQRNSLLKGFAEREYYDLSLIEIWNEQLIKFGMDIYRKRKDFIQDFIPVFKQYFSIISNNREGVDITYESQLHDKTLDKLLKESFEKDKVLRYTTAGIHKDDLSFGINSYPLKRFGSQGQQKSFIIAIKLAQFDYTKNIKGFKPILLFDDIFDKLDETRVTQLIQLVSQDSFGQVVITDTQYDRIEKLTNSLSATYHVWEIEAGILNLINSLRHD
ncbi:MAG: DNA replication/repair protein RecF [Bacteroidales bacterium]|jgi:DNA replication and repair protein RecF|nr:DNA replication/repair protein RecF [Bacteroidales bacterium]